MGRAKAWRRPVTRTISMPAAWARRRASRSSDEILNWGFSRVPSMSVAIRRMGKGGVWASAIGLRLVVLASCTLYCDTGRRLGDFVLPETNLKHRGHWRAQGKSWNLWRDILRFPWDRFYFF